MTTPAFSVEVQWALYGILQGRERPRLLAHSSGELGARNFEAAISRFGPDATEEPAQVSVSYLTPANEPDASYLAVAIRRCADPAGEGQPADLTSYFCLPYTPLAAKAVTYQTMHRALAPIGLPAGNGSPLRVEVAVSGQPTAPAVDGRALQAAALLLTNRAVCVIGAGDTPMPGRLAFIDTVMALLPYGLRARMAASTWAASANKDHKFRLFFSDAPRPGDAQDHLLNWEDAEAQTVSGADEWAHDYLTWLSDKVSQPAAELARLTTPIPFKRDPILAVLDEIGIYDRGNPSQNYSNTQTDFLPETAPRTERGREQILLECAERVRAVDQDRAKSDIIRPYIGKIKSLVDQADDAQQARYREIIRKGRLLEHNAKRSKWGPKLHDELLRVAFAVPFSYAGYCQVEDCLGGRPPGPGLLTAIVRCGMADQLAAAVVYWRIANPEPRNPTGGNPESNQTAGRRAGRRQRETVAQRLEKWGEHADTVSVADLIRDLGSSQTLRPEHARIVCDVTLEYLSLIKEGADRRALREALFGSGYLAHAHSAIGTRPVGEQVKALGAFLAAAYPDRLNRDDILRILGDTKPTPALFAAVLLGLQLPASDLELAWHAFALGSMSGLTLIPEDRTQLLSVLPPADPGRV